MSPLDLHVLGTPPAFVLSQDQTLSFNPFIRIPSSRLSRSLSELTVVLSCVFSLYRFQGSAPLARSLYILSNHRPFVNTFFKVFGRFFCISLYFERYFCIQVYCSSMCTISCVVCKRYTSSLFVSILLHSPYLAGKEADICSLRAVLRGFSPLRRRPGGFPLAPWTPSAGYLFLR